MKTKLWWIFRNVLTNVFLLNSWINILTSYSSSTGKQSISFSLQSFFFHHHEVIKFGISWSNLCDIRVNNVNQFAQSAFSKVAKFSIDRNKKTKCYVNVYFCDRTGINFQNAILQGRTSMIGNSIVSTVFYSKLLNSFLVFYFSVLYKAKICFNFQWMKKAHRK